MDYIAKITSNVDDAYNLLATGQVEMAEALELGARYPAWQTAVTMSAKKYADTQKLAATFYEAMTSHFTIRVKADPSLLEGFGLSDEQIVKMIGKTFVARLAWDWTWRKHPMYLLPEFNLCIPHQAVTKLYTAHRALKLFNLVRAAQ